MAGGMPNSEIHLMSLCFIKKKINANVTYSLLKLHHIPHIGNCDVLAQKKRGLFMLILSTNVLRYHSENFEYLIDRSEPTVQTQVGFSCSLIRVKTVSYSICSF